MPDVNNPLRLLPASETVAAPLRAAGASTALATQLARSAIAGLRTQLQDGKQSPVTREELAQLAINAAEAELAALLRPPLTPVINATGTVLHTGLGRAPLSARAKTAVEAVLSGYNSVEFDLANGLRGDRQDHVAPLLCALTGAEAALVVNNCAGATVLMLQALAQHREVIVSRGELVEIGGSFRVPEVMACAGCTLMEVGATNKTHPHDYLNAITDDTALLLKVHRSNFTVEGFTAEVSTAELADIARARGLPVAVDQGSGAVRDLSDYGVTGHSVQQELEAGANIVCCSGDKLLGGPQAGILLGDAATIARCKRHPLARALRVDKLTLAALAGTLVDYLVGDAATNIPTLALLAEDPTAVRARAEGLHTLINHACASVIDDQAAVGSGASPTHGPATSAVALSVDDPANIAALLRQGDPAVVPRIKQDRVLLDARTIRLDQVEALATRVREVLGV